MVEKPQHFSGEIAKSHLDVLAAYAPRVPGSEADIAARAYLSATFRKAGATVEVIEDDQRRHLAAQLSGESEDTLLLVAPYPSLERDEWIGDSGAALLLELARVWPREHPRYTLRLALAETRAIVQESEANRFEGATAQSGGLADGGLEGGPREARRRVVSAGESLARTLDAAGGFEGLRCIIVFDGSGRPGLRVARDLRSHPVYREEFWASARELGFESVFPTDSGWASPRSLHLGFLEQAMDGVVAIVDEARARPEMEPFRVLGKGSADSLEALGLVTIEAVGRIMDRLSRIDDFDSQGVLDESAARGSEQAAPRLSEIPPSS